ncbi:prolyl oligopeptidase family serine peptidase [Pseudoduganella sp. FT25W]|uniref:prolyl oligopeptidase n=1 Tax=Duganella alba TaxID=2666081 RepID=A0A6L5QE57_9BURK|nr:prolyl oligopeptidase family serine peptidase [Duganella alba]MRX07572.1 prolyl oligopeptidase family serine peptidase [Duganella alba]MRX15957.1 prolyl oligopeptidase family serine peptidase [Duganella alba]
MKPALYATALVLAVSSSFAADIPPAPVARIAPVTDTYFGETITDRYRWMENDKDPDWLPFLKQQNAHTRAILDTLPRRDELLKRIQQLSGDIAAPARVQKTGARLFYQQRPAGSNNFKLFVREGGKDRVLVDPTKLDTKTSHVSLDWWHPSPDGSKLAYGLSKDGSEDSVLYIMDVRNGTVLKERIANTESAEPSWLADSSGFFYNQLTGKVNTPERYLDAQARFHKVGTDAAKDPVLMKRGLDAGVQYEKIQSPYIEVFPHSDTALLLLSDVRQEKRIYAAPLKDALAGKAKWQLVADFADEVIAVDLHGDDLYLLSTRGHPRGRLLKTSANAPALASAQEVAPESDLVLQGLARAKEGLYIRAMDGGISKLQRLGTDGKVASIALPFDGTLGAVDADADAPGALVILSGWLQPTGIWSVSADGKLADTGITPKPAIDTSAYTTERRFATAKDGTRIPYSLIYKKGLKMDGKNPAFISAYGSYGAAAYSPAFAGRTLALVDQGAIVGYANVRGGGEFGREWHRAGQLENKPNTWRDLIAVCEEIQAKGYTSPAYQTIGGRSAGGITMGRALEERPDLFAAVISGVGWHNPLRYVAEQNGYGEEPEWGAIADPAGFKALKSIDSYQQVVDGTKYPAVLLTTGVTDPRVAPFHPAKMAARLQAATASGKPVLLRVDFDAGHGMGSTRAQQDAEAADTYAFILSQTAGAAAK